MSEFHDDYPSYETLAHHSEEEGKPIRKNLWRVCKDIVKNWVGLGNW